MTGTDSINSAVNLSIKCTKLLQTSMLYETDSFQKRIEEYKPKAEDRSKPSLKRTRCEDVSKTHNAISKGEDRGKPSLQRTRREEVPIAHTRKMKTGGNIFIIERKTSKGEDGGKPSPTGTRRKDGSWAQGPWARTDWRIK